MVRREVGNSEDLDRITQPSTIDISFNKRFNVSVQNRIEVRQLDASFYILY